MLKSIDYRVEQIIPTLPLVKQEQFQHLQRMSGFTVYFEPCSCNSLVEVIELSKHSVNKTALILHSLCLAIYLHLAKGNMKYLRLTESRRWKFSGFLLSTYELMQSQSLRYRTYFYANLRKGPPFPEHCQPVAALVNSTL